MPVKRGGGRREDDAEGMLDRMLLREAARMTAGASVYHQLDPAELVMRMEGDAEDDLWTQRSEVLAAWLDYLFGTGPAPWDVLDRLDAFLRDALPELGDRLGDRRKWVEEIRAEMVLRWHLGKLEWSEGETAGEKWIALGRLWEADGSGGVLGRLADFVVGRAGDWRQATAVVYSMAKALRPELIGGMSLEDMAVLCGDGGGRATAQARTKRVFSDEVTAAGFRASQVHFQKSASVVVKYRAAQQGNHNRRDGALRKLRSGRKFQAIDRKSQTNNQEPKSA